MSAFQQVKEKKNEFLSVTSNNMLRCDAYSETLSKKKNTVCKYIGLAKHNVAKKAIQNSKKKDQSLFTFLEKMTKKLCEARGKS